MSLRKRVCAPPVPELPSGLLELMDGLARDVLKNNPENIYEFCAQHMQTLLEIRDGRGPKTFLTLDQKIAEAQKKVRERAEQRRHNYDKELLSATNVSNKSDILSPLNTANDLSIGPDDNLKIHDITKSTNVKISIDKEENQIKIPDNNSNQKGLLKATDDKIKEEEECMSYQETPKFNLISEENESANLAIDNSVGCKDANGLEQTEEKITLSLKQEAVEFEITEYVSKNTSNRPLQTDENPIITQSEINDETVSSRDVESQLQSEDIKKDTKNNIEIDKEINETTINGKSDEIFWPENYLTDISAPSVITATLDNNSHSLEGVAPVKANKNEYEPENIALLENESNKKTNEEISTSENNNVIEKQTENLDQEDDKIRAVILNKKGGDSDIQVQDKGLVVSNNEPNQSPKKVADPENVAEPVNDKTNNNLMDLETAAITIQKVFRSFLFKTKTLSYDDSTTVDINLLNGDKEKEENEALTIQLKDRRPLGISRMDTVLQTVNEEKSLSLSTDDSSTLSSAATIIQAHVRGFLVRNKYNLNKTTSTNSLIDSDAPSIPSLEADSENRKSKTILNIHIVPEGGHFVSRDESILTSMDLSLDSSPPSSVNLHPLGYDKSERRKQLKREDAIQSVSPPSNNSGKLSDEHDSVKEILTGTEKQESVFDENVINTTDDVLNKVDNALNYEDVNIENLTADVASDDMDVITPLLPFEEKSSHVNDNSSKLLHSGEFHDVVVPTNVTRSDTSVVREFQNVLVYFIMWNN